MALLRSNTTVLREAHGSHFIKKSVLSELRVKPVKLLRLTLIQKHSTQGE